MKHHKANSNLPHFHKLVKLFNKQYLFTAFVCIEFQLPINSFCDFNRINKLRVILQSFIFSALKSNFNSHIAQVRFFYKNPAPSVGYYSLKNQWSEWVYILRLSIFAVFA